MISNNSDKVFTQGPLILKMNFYVADIQLCLV